MADKKKNLRLTTPKGIAKFPHLTSPDTKFNSDGEYHVKLLFEPDEIAEFQAQIEKAIAQSVKDAKTTNPKYAKQIKASANPPVRPELDKEGNETGKIEVSAKLKAKVTPKEGEPWEQRPALFDAKGKPVEGLKIGGGSVLKANVEISPYFSAKDKEAGVSLRLKAVQVVKLVEFGSARDASAFGFEAEEDGFEAGDDTASGNGFSDESASAGEDVVDDDESADF